MPKFCSECGASFAAKPNVPNNLKKLFPENTVAPAEAKSPSPEQNARINATLENMMSPQYKVNILPKETSTEQQFASDDIEYIDSEDFDTSKFKYIKPQFKIQAQRNEGISFENLLTNGYVNNYKPSNDFLDGNIPMQNRTADDVLNDFQKEAGSLRRNNAQD
jgi:hypothetical protein